MTRHGIFWLASYPKSGNTWVRSLVTSLQAGGAGVQLDSLGKLAPNGAARAWLEGCVDLDSEGLTHAEMRAMRVHAYRRVAARRSCLLKVHDVCDPALFPVDATLGTVYIVRDPRDVAPSWADHMGVNLDAAIAQMADPGLTMSASLSSFRPQALQHYGSWSLHVQSWLDHAPGPLLLLRYEDMLSDPWHEATRLASFLGLAADAASVERSVHACRFEALRSAEEQGGFGERRKGQQRFFRQGRAGAWQSVLQPQQAARLAEQHGEVMRRLGYAVGAVSAG